MGRDTVNQEDTQDHTQSTHDNPGTATPPTPKNASGHQPKPRQTMGEHQQLICQTLGRWKRIPVHTNTPQHRQCSHPLSKPSHPIAYFEYMITAFEVTSASHKLKESALKKKYAIFANVPYLPIGTCPKKWSSFITQTVYLSTMLFGSLRASKTWAARYCDRHETLSQTT